MKLKYLIPILFLCLTGVIGRSAAQSPKMKLFNGKNLDGWYTFIKDRGRDTDPKKVFTVKNGKIRISGEEWGCITTNKEYGNYKLVIDFRWGEKTWGDRLMKARDSGVLLHSRGEDGGHAGIWMHSIEVQLIEGGTGDFIVVGNRARDFSIECPVAPEKQGRFYVYQPGGEYVRVYSGRVNWIGRDPLWEDRIDFRGKNDVEKRRGKWNRLECMAVDGKIDVYLNGMLVNQAINVIPEKGRIQVQSEGAELWIRKVELIPQASY